VGRVPPDFERLFREVRSGTYEGPTPDQLADVILISPTWRKMMAKPKCKVAADHGVAVAKGYCSGCWSEVTKRGWETRRQREVDKANGIVAPRVTSGRKPGAAVSGRRAVEPAKDAKPGRPTLAEAAALEAVYSATPEEAAALRAAAHLRVEPPPADDLPEPVEFLDAGLAERARGWTYATPDKKAVPFVTATEVYAWIAWAMRDKMPIAAIAGRLGAEEYDVEGIVSDLRHMGVEEFKALLAHAPQKAMEKEKGADELAQLKAAACGMRTAVALPMPSAVAPPPNGKAGGWAEAAERMRNEPDEDAEPTCPACEGVALVRGSWCPDCGREGVEPVAAIEPPPPPRVQDEPQPVGNDRHEAGPPAAAPLPAELPAGSLEAYGPSAPDLGADGFPRTPFGERAMAGDGVPVDPTAAASVDLVGPVDQLERYEEIRRFRDGLAADLIIRPPMEEERGGSAEEDSSSAGVGSARVDAMVGASRANRVGALLASADLWEFLSLPAEVRHAVATIVGFVRGD